MRKIVLILLSIISVMQIYAGSLKSTPTGKNFPLNGQIVLNGKDIPAEQYGEFRDAIVKNGGTILYKFTVKKLILPTISIKQVAKITGSTDRDAFQILVTQKNVKITYTTIKSLKIAAETFKGLIVTDSFGDKCIRGGKYIWVIDNTSKTETKKSHMANEIKELSTNIDKMSAGSETELILITPDEWMVESTVLESVSGNKDLYSKTNGYVTLEDLKDVVEKAKARGVILKLTMQMHQENVPFKETLGHSLFSVEGMRFFRAAIQQWHDICGVETIYTGTASEHDMTIQRFDDFLDRISQLTGTKLIH